MKQWIQKVLSEQGICSRRAAERMIEQGLVRINGRPAKIGDQIELTDVVSIEGRRVYFKKRNPKVCYALYKPRGILTAMSDDRDRVCVNELVADVGVRLFPIGRLDKDSEGLLLMTNDGELANAVMHPSRKVGKTYRVSVAPGVNEEQLIALTGGVRLDDGYVTQPAVIRVTDNAADRAVLEMTIYEGKNRQIRRMCEAVGLTVKRLKRTAVGPIRLGGLTAGKYRELTRQELTALWNATGTR